MLDRGLIAELGDGAGLADLLPLGNRVPSARACAKASRASRRAYSGEGTP